MKKHLLMNNNLIVQGKGILLTMFLLTAVSLFLISCSKDEDGGQISYKIKPVNSSASVGTTVSGSGLVVAANTNSSIIWTSGTLNISEIDFEAESEQNEVEFELKKFISVDLANLSPVLGSISIPDGTYEEVELKIVLKNSSTNAYPLTLKGAYTDASGRTTPVEFYFNEELELEVEAENVVVESNNYIGLINFELNRLISQVSSTDFSDAVKTDGKIIISSTSNVHIYNKIKSSLSVIGDCDFDD